MPDEYRAVLNLDYTGGSSNEYNRLLASLERAGWYYVETSAMAYDGDLDGIRLALDVLGRAIGYPGTPSAVTFQAQLIGAPRDAPGDENGNLWLPRLLEMDRAPIPPN